MNLLNNLYVEYIRDSHERVGETLDLQRFSYFVLWSDLYASTHNFVYIRVHVSIRELKYTQNKLEVCKKKLAFETTEYYYNKI